MSRIYQGISALSYENIEIQVEQGVITGVRPITSASASPLPYIAPGFLDMQVNGYGGCDYSLDDLSIDHVRRIAAFLAAAGVTQHVATVVTAPKERILRNLKVLTGARNTVPELEAALVGIHLEGPFLSAEEGPRGAHDPRFLRDPDFEEFLQWQEAAQGLIRIVTVAPERDGALDFIERLSASGVIAAIGHTAADPDTIHAAIRAGARLSTHLGNGSHAYLPRLKNYLWEQLAADDLAAGLICDGDHLPASVVKTLTRVKGLDRLILVSDAALLGGSEPGVYSWGNLKVRVYADGHLGLLDTPFLAGAGHLLDWDLPRFMEYTGSSLAETVPLCTRNPAKLLGLPACYGTLTPGAPANLTLFAYSPGDQRLQIANTISAGHEVFSHQT